jgi:hypothetical protein
LIISSLISNGDSGLLIILIRDSVEQGFCSFSEPGFGIVCRPQRLVLGSQLIFQWIDISIQCDFLGFVLMGSEVASPAQAMSYCDRERTLAK